MTQDISGEVKVTLSQFTRDIARISAHEVVVEHSRSCPAICTVPSLTQRVTAVEVKVSNLIWFLVGSGILGGAAGGLLGGLIATLKIK